MAVATLVSSVLGLLIELPKIAGFFLELEFSKGNTLVPSVL